MTTATESRPFIVHELSQSPMAEAQSQSGLEMRSVGLRVASNLLSMRVADIDGARAASNVADLRSCPICGTHPRRAA